MHTPSKSIEVPTLDINASLYSDRPMPAHVRMEQRIVAALIAHMGEHGWTPCEIAESGERHPVSDAKSAMEWIFNLDDSFLVLTKVVTVPAVDAIGQLERTYTARHWIRLITGNGRDIVSDYSCTPSNADGFDTVVSAFDTEVYE